MFALFLCRDDVVGRGCAEGKIAPQVGRVRKMGEALQTSDRGLVLLAGIVQDAR